MMPALDYEQTMRGSLPPILLGIKRWLLWRNEPREGANRKVPYYANGKRRQGTLDTEADWANLVTFDVAMAAYKAGNYSGLGLALGPLGDGNYLQGIDGDYIEKHPEAKAAFDRMPGYVEWSPSGKGVHSLGIGAEFRSLGSNDSGIEAYAKMRYFTVTGNAIRGDLEDVSDFVNTVLVPLHSPRRAAQGAQPERSGSQTESVFAKVNAKAMQNLSAWVPSLFPRAREYHDGYRVSSKDLGRNLEEDISILPKGIKDFGEERGVTPIDLVIEWGAVSDAKGAALWLCSQLGVAPKSLGWKGATDNVVPLKTKTRPAEQKTEEPFSVPEGAAAHFRPLGYDGDKFYFMTARGQQVRELSANKLGRKPELMTLAPLDWWEREFAEDSGFSGRPVDMAVNYLIQQCLSQGVFSLDRRRGRGVWRDDGRIVIHLGDRLVIDGKETDLVSAQTEGVYERQPAMRLSLNDPLPVDEARKLLELAKALNFELVTHGRLWAGWLVVSIISGALVWRPHTFLNGPKGCGKTTNLSIATRIMGQIVLSVTGGTTAAGLRQTLMNDALPVIFDEAEGDSQHSARIMDEVLALMRHASAGFDAKVLKGGADGKAQSSTIQSCFLLSAIRDPIQQAADQSRVTVLPLRAITAVDERVWREEAQPLAEMLCTPAWSARLIARVLTRVPQLLQTIDVYREAASAFFGDARMGDQIGTLLAGGWLLASDKIPTIGAATKDLDALPWHDQEQVLEDASDERSCLNAIQEAHIRIDAEGGWHGDASIGELVAMLVNNARAPGACTASDARRALAMYGLGVTDDGYLLISNTNTMLGRKIMAHTSWPKGWGKILARHPLAKRLDKTVWLGGQATRAVAILVKERAQPNGLPPT